MDILLVIIAVLLLLCLYLIWLYSRKIRAMNVIIRGTDLIKEQDFGSRLVPVGQEDADKIIMLFNRMMEQLKNEKLKIKEQNHLLNLLIENSPMGVIILDFDGAVSMLNSAAVEFLGVGGMEEAVGKRIGELDTPLARAIGKVPQGESDTIRLGNSVIYRCSKLSFMDRGFQHPFILIESLTAEVMKAEKKAYGKVIRMMAHEVNNTVAGISTTMNALKEVLGESGGMDGAAQMVEACVERSGRMSRFVNRFADVVRIPQPQLRPVQLNVFLNSCRHFLESLCSCKDISLEYSLDGSCGEVMLDTVLFEQVVINIVKNAVESAPSHIRIASYKTPDNLTVLDISNNGAPILPETAARLFTPFFTTKPSGQGLGLILIREVLTSHSCRFSLRTREDGITHFIVNYFPNREE